MANKPKALIVAGFKHYDITGARPIIGKLVNDAHAGNAVVINSSRGRAAALIPVHLLTFLTSRDLIKTIREEPALGAAGQLRDAYIIGQDEPRNDTLPSEVTAHSREQELQAAFEQPPIDPDMLPSDELTPEEEEYFENMPKEEF